MKKLPLVSVFCLCYNHEKYVSQAIQSVLNQTYSNIELIVVDDASTDGSKGEIEQILKNQQFTFLYLPENVGNTKAFNRAFVRSNGKYIIDLAADDVLVQDRIEKQVAFFEESSNSTGVIYSDVAYIDGNGQPLSHHFSNKKHIPYTGNVYEKLISTYFIPPPSMMMKREVLEQLNGYDENLAYEDFDFWIRSSRDWLYAYQPEKLTLVRRLEDSLSSKAYSKHDKQLYSTYVVCKKIKSLNKTESENRALRKRLEYEIRHSVFSGNYQEAKLFVALYREMKALPITLRLLELLNRLKIDFSFLRNLYQKLVRLVKKNAPYWFY
ncbi:glycosyltransferase [Reichenbachiella sp. MALMAid0571]|uniref:glycosyltransferase n=1 Tax=Reichenbachiella sp. MALMAid0571 TaxID=3143939 RepID=UPI0032DFFA6B